MIANNIFSANTVCNNLKEYEEKFKDEYKVISELKCLLVNEQEIADYLIGGIWVGVEGDGSDYYLSFNDTKIHVYVKDKMIVDYEYE